MQRPATVDAYIATAPPAQRAVLSRLRALIRKHLSDAVESLGPNGFAVYTDDAGKWLAGFAWRNKGPVLYVMNASVLGRYAKQLGPLRSGKSCIDWRATKALSIEDLTRLAEQMLRETAADAPRA